MVADEGGDGRSTDQKIGGFAAMIDQQAIQRAAIELRPILKRMLSGADPVLANMYRGSPGKIVPPGRSKLIK